MARPSTHSIQVTHRFEARSAATFDRIAYAMEVLAILRPHLTVAVYRRVRNLEVQRGVSPGSDQRWATVGVPPHATRESIAQALVELSEVQDQPFLLDLLCARDSSAANR